MGHLLSQIGVTPQKEAQFLTRGICSIEDLVEYLPRRYLDYRKIKKVDDVEDGDTCTLCGTIIRKETGPRMNILHIRDSLSNYKFKIVFFGGDWLYNKIGLNEQWFFCGTCLKDLFGVSMTNPRIVTQTQELACHIVPKYPKVKGMSDDYLTKKIDEGLSFLRTTQVLDDRNQLAKTLNLPTYPEAMRELHNPTDGNSYKIAKTRYDYDQMYGFYTDLYQSRRYDNIVTPVLAPSDVKTQTFIKGLPFSLTKGQNNAIQSIITKGKVQKRVNAIVTGDVGCGKTLVAVACTQYMQENGLQTVVMAPTLVLAKQHFEEFSKDLPSVKIALLTSETKKKERAQIFEGLFDGSIEVLIGTHSVLSSEIQFKNLGMTILDEEHKFGVAQKEILENYDKLGAHHISMTATPIPRSYALSVYGDMLEVLPIPDMPSGRKVTITKHIWSKTDTFKAIYDEIKNGHQAYLVVPFIEDSENENLQSIESIRSITETARDWFDANHPEVRLESIDGSMKQKDILSVIGRFSAGDIDLLISTTIVEVGVNVPNATVIAIMNADRFGLASLHQLRGRVGRKGDQGYCLLVSDRKSEKLDIMCDCSSGFEIAEKDAKMRGPGDLVGDAQTGKDSLAIIQTILKRPKLAAMIRDHLAATM